MLGEMSGWMGGIFNSSMDRTSSLASCKRTLAWLTTGKRKLDQLTRDSITELHTISLDLKWIQFRHIGFPSLDIFLPFRKLLFVLPHERFLKFS